MHKQKQTLHLFNRRLFLKSIATTLTAFYSNKLYANSTVKILASLGQKLGFTTVLSENDAAEKLSLNYNKARRIIPQARLLARPRSGFSNLIARLAEEDQGFAIRSGGHCFGGFSQHPDLVLDLRDLNQVEVDPTSRLVKAGPGANIGNLYDALTPHGLTLPAGTHRQVGLGGHVLGGGFGYYSRHHGMLCDRLRALKIVTADGRVLTASPEQNSDLFWACQGGGGGSLGLVLEFTFEAFPFDVHHAIKFSDTASAPDAARILYNWQFWSKLSPNHTTHLHFSRHSDSKFSLFLTGVSVDPSRAKLETEIGQVFGLRHPIHPNYIRTTSQKKIEAFLYDQHLYSSAIFNSRSDYLNEPLLLDAIQNFVQVLMQYPPNSVEFVFEALGGEISKIAKNTTAFPHRKAEILIQYTSEIWKPEQREIRERAMAHVSHVLSPYVTGGAYVNYPDLNLKNWQQAYWGDNFARLQSVKRKYDPNNVFNHPHSIPL
ncbi:MAG: FAD-binding oxidoreductase [Hyphomicrobiales bacterium]